MALSDEFEMQGAWLFRWRSYLPLFCLLLIGIALHDYRWPFRSYFDYKAWVTVCFAVSMFGLAIRCVTIGHTPAGTSGRNTKRQIAKQLNTSGMYSLSRHPLYLGNYFIGLGIALAPAVWWLPLMYSLLFCAYYERIMFAEEFYLQRVFGKEFINWAAATPAFFPRFKNWRKPVVAILFPKRASAGIYRFNGSHSGQCRDSVYRAPHHRSSHRI